MRDEALSDIVGTILMLGVTTAVIGLVSVVVLGAAGDEEPAPAIEVAASASPGDASVLLAHMGGADLDPTDVRVVVGAGAAVLHDGALGLTRDPWGIGDVAAIPLSSALAPDEDVEISLVSISDGATLATIVARVGPAAGPEPSASGFSLVLAFEDGSSSTSVQVPAPLVLRATATHPAGRLAVSTVVADLASIDAAAIALRDDGAAGDLRAGDGVFSGTTVLPPTASIGAHLIEARATDLDGSIATATATITVETGPLGGGGGSGGSAGADGSGSSGSDGSGSSGSDGSDGGSGSAGSEGGAGAGGADAPTYPERQLYNRSIFSAFAHRILKYEAGPSDSLTTTIKFRLVADPLTIGGRSYALSRVSVNYDWIKPGNVPWVILNEGSGSDMWRCHDAATRVYLFEASNVTINSFEHEWDPMFYYIIIEWREVGGTASYVETVSSSALDQYFTLRRTEDEKVVLDEDGWSPDFATCSDAR